MKHILTITNLLGDFNKGNKMVDIERKLARIDLNLFISLSVLLQEKNVSRAAERLYLSQSAMSRTLQRLRDTFDDPLFHRTSKGITPTVRAMELELLLPSLLSNIESIIEKNNFDPKNSDKTFAISVPPLLSSALIPNLLTSIGQVAPNIVIHEHQARIKPLSSLESGHLDFSFHIEDFNLPNLCSDEIGEIKLAIFSRQDHPLTKTKKVTLEDCLKFKFVELLINRSDESTVVHPLAKILFNEKISREIACKSNQLSTLLTQLKSNDYLMIGGKVAGLSTHLSEDIVDVFEFDVAKSKQVKLYLVSHQRTLNSDAHQWLRNKILNSFFSLPEQN